MKEVSPII